MMLRHTNKAAWLGLRPPKEPRRCWWAHLLRRDRRRPATPRTTALRLLDAVPLFALPDARKGALAATLLTRKTLSQGGLAGLAGANLGSLSIRNGVVVFSRHEALPRKKLDLSRPRALHIIGETAVHGAASGNHPTLTRPDVYEVSGQASLAKLSCMNRPSIATRSSVDALPRRAKGGMLVLREPRRAASGSVPSLSPPPEFVHFRRCHMG